MTVTVFLGSIMFMFMFYCCMAVFLGLVGVFIDAYRTSSGKESIKHFLFGLGGLILVAIVWHMAQMVS